MTEGMNMGGLGGLNPIGPATPQTTPSSEGGGKSFQETLFEKISEVNSLQQEADSAMSSLVQGKTDNVSDVFVAVQKADLAFKTLMQIRNKLLDAYQEISQLRL